MCITCVSKRKDLAIKLDEPESIITDFGNRKISDQNFSKIITLPKTALVDCGNPRKMNVKLVVIIDRKCVMLTPVPKTPEEEIEDKMPSGSMF